MANSLTNTPSANVATIEVSAVVIQDTEGRVLNVRKRGTSTFMLPGGKPEPGEDPRDTAIREFREELGVELDPFLLRGLGTFRSAAANEAGFDVLAHVFVHPFVSVDHPLAEIEQLEWVLPGDPPGARGALVASASPEEFTMAPLNTEHVFPAIAKAGRPAQRIAVFTGSSLGNSPEFAQVASDFGTALAHEGIGLVYGGGRVGLMGAIADGVITSGGETLGVITEALLDGETGHTGLTRLEVVKTMTERKNRMAALTDAFVALPGGPGTLEEFFEAWTWMTLGIHHKPVALYDVNGYWQPLLRAIDAMVDSGFSSVAARDALIVASSPRELFDAIADWRPPQPKWTQLTPVPVRLGT